MTVKECKIKEHDYTPWKVLPIQYGYHRAEAHCKKCNKRIEQSFLTQIFSHEEFMEQVNSQWHQNK